VMQGDLKGFFKKHNGERHSIASGKNSWLVGMTSGALSERTPIPLDLAQDNIVTIVKITQ